MLCSNLSFSCLICLQAGTFFFLELVLLEIEIAFNEAVTEGIQEILNQIGEGNEIFKDLAVLVNDQGAMIV